VEKHGQRGMAIAVDVADEDGVAEAIPRVAQTLGRLDVLVNNAGIADRNPAKVHESSTADWRHVIDVNLNGVFYCSHEALKVMVAQGSGKIINIASMWGTVGSSSVFPLPAYTATKGAVVNLTREMGLQYAASGIQVNALCPGFYRTRLAGGAYDDPAFVEAITAFTPMGRIADAEEIRGPALFLASDASNFMTGQLLVADGGCTAK
jgi:NAD(P)-dependent dehydrogenase (short-subunit alcohol dehydrogenase family)